MNKNLKKFHRILIFILFFFIILIYFFKNYKNYKKYEKFTSNINVDPYSDKYAQVYNKIFDDKKIPENDIQQIIHTIKPDENDTFLDAGTGVGNHYKFINYKSIGIDRSSSLLKYAQLNNPLGTFINDNLANKNVFEKEKFNHILCLQDTFYHNSNEQMEIIVKNFNYWLNASGTCSIHIFDNKNLDPSPRTFSILSNGPNNTLYSTTKFKEFNHIAHWENITKYCEKIKFNKSGKTFEKCHKMNIPDKKVIIKMFLDNGFKLKDIVDLIAINMNRCNIYIFEKK